MIRLICNILLFGLIFFVGCKSQNPTESPKDKFVLATTGMLADAAVQLLPKAVSVKSLMGPGVDPHSYKVTYGDLELLQESAVILYNGLELEGKMAGILKKYSKSKPCYAIAEALPKANLIFHHGEAGPPDPHIWFDVKLWLEAVKEVERVLVINFPELKNEITSNSTKYQAQLLELDLWAKQQILEIPKNQRLLITAHDAFSYFGRAYEIEVEGLQGISTAAEFGLFDVKKLADVIIDRKIKAIFVESSVSPKFVMALQAGVKARNHEVIIGGELYSDALGMVGSGAENYIGMVRSNITTIVRALK